MSAVASSAGNAVKRTVHKGSKYWAHKSPALTVCITTILHETQQSYLISLIASLQNVVNNQSKSPIQISPDHDAPMGSWSSEQIRDAAASSTMMTWNPGKAKHGLPLITHGKGVYLYDDQGKQYLDWTSQAVCSNIGYDMPPTVLNAITQQLETLPFIYGGLGLCEIRARLTKLLSEILPGDLQGMVFHRPGQKRMRPPL